MNVDPAVSRRKFDVELRRLRNQQEVLHRRGCFVLGEPEFPIIEFLLVPKNPLLIPVSPPPNLQPGLIFNAEISVLAGRAFKVRADLSDFDLRPPSITFHDPWTDEPLEYERMFRALERAEGPKPNLVLLGDHPVEHRPFLCIKGTREYHEHPQHTGDEWLLYRSEMSFFSLLIHILRVCIDLPHPQLLLSENGLQVNWTLKQES